MDHGFPQVAECVAIILVEVVGIFINFKCFSDDFGG